MKINELFDQEDHDGDSTSSSFGYHVTKKIGDRLLQFEAARSGETWEVSFGQKMPNGALKYQLTKTGDEIQVFSFIVSAMRSFVKKYQPKRIQFSVRKIEGSRASLYRKLVDRFLKDSYWKQEYEIGLGSAEKYVQFDLIKKPTSESLDEAFDKATKYKVVTHNKHEFCAEFESNGRTIRVDIEEMGGNFGWDIGFIEKSGKNGGMGDWAATGSGGELEVFATVKAIVHQFLQEYKPKKIGFASDRSELNRGKLYDRFVKRGMFPGYRLIKRTDDPRQIYDKWVLVRDDLDEGMMKRSNPFVSGELELPKARERSIAPTPVSTNVRVEKMLKNLAQRANVDVSVVRKARDEIMKDVDSKHPNRWNIIMSRLNRRLGL